MRAVERAIEVGLFRPLYVVSDHKIDFAVAIVVDPCRAGRELVRPPQSRGFRDVGKGSVAVIVEKMALADGGNEDVVEAVVVVISDRNAHPKERNAEAGLASHVGEGAIMIVVIKLQSRCRAP